MQKRIGSSSYGEDAAAGAIEARRTSALVGTQRVPARPRLRHEWLWVLGLCLLFGILSARRAVGHPYPLYDDVAYLDLGNRVREIGGPVRLVAELYRARFTEDLRNPLYPALLSVVAGRDVGYHRRAQVLAVALGVAALLCCWLASRRLLGSRVAVATLACLSINSTLIEQSARESVETLLLVFWVLSLVATLASRHRAAPWLIAGGLCGLAFLCKGTALFLLGAVVLSLVIERGFRIFGERSLWCYLAGFAIVASPLLVRNVRMHGWPSHNSTARVRLLWSEPMPDYAEIFAPDVEARLPSTIVDYWKKTSLAKIGARLGRGALETVVALGESLSINPPRLYGPWHVVLIALGVAGALFAISLTCTSPPSFGRTLLLVQTAWFFAFFVLWNAQGVLSRYFLPIAVGLIAVLASAVMCGTDKAQQWRIRSQWVFASLVLGAATLSFAFDRSTNRPRREFLEAQRWIVENVHPGEGYAVASRSHLQPRWLVPATVRELLVSASWNGRPLPPDEIIAFLRKHDIRYVVLDANSHVDRLSALRQCDVPYFIVDRRCRERARARHPGDRRYLFYDRIPLDKFGGLLLTDLPQGLRVVYVTPKRRWAVLELENYSP